MSERQKEIYNTKQDQLLRMTPAEVEAWIEDNVDDLASAKEVLIKLAKFLAVLSKRESK